VAQEPPSPSPMQMPLSNLISQVPMPLNPEQLAFMRAFSVQ
jgi:hypothetical protein